MSGRTVMEKADDIMASMGLADTVPLAEATTESINSVGKNYGEELPELSDDQRNALLEHSLGEGNLGQELRKRGLTGAGNEFDPSGGKKVLFKKKKLSEASKWQRQARGRQRIGKPLKKGHAKHVASDEGADLDAQITAADRLAKKKADKEKGHLRPASQATIDRATAARKKNPTLWAKNQDNNSSTDDTDMGTRTRLTPKEKERQKQARIQAKLQKEAIARKISKLNEMTTIGMLGSSSVGGKSGSNWSPAKKKKKKGRKSSSKFISFQLGKV